MDANGIMARSNARSQVYAFLALALSYPDERHPDSLGERYDPLPDGMAILGDASTGEAVEALRPAMVALSAASLADGHTRCFGHAMSKDCPPYEAEYGQAHIFQKTHTLADVAGFYRAFGLDLAADSHERVDHVSVELEFMHFLCLKEAYALANGHPAEQLALCREAQREFLCEHVCRWAFGFARRLCARAGDTVYQDVGRLLATFLEAELRALGSRPDDVAGPDMIEEGAQTETANGADPRWNCQSCHDREAMR